MDNNGFDGFDGFDSTGFGDNSFDDIDFGDQMTSSFDDDFSAGSFEKPSLNADNQQDEPNQFEGTFDNVNTVQDALPQDGGLKKQGIIFLVVGIILLVIIIIIASKVNSSLKNKQNVQSNTNTTQQTSQDNTAVGANNVSQNVDNVIGSSSTTVTKQQTQKSQESTVNNQVDENGFKWTSITDQENIVFDDEYMDMTFTITDISHYARVVDATNTLEVKTNLTGSIGGLPGTYVLEIPYDKGAGLVEGSHKLVVGDYFTVHVQIGTYNNRKIVGKILY